MLILEGLHLPARMPMTGLPRHCLLPQLQADTPEGMREKWLLRRRESLGASDIPAILGESPWESACSTWASKTGLKEIDTSEMEHQRFGHLMEGVIHEELEARYPEIRCVDPKAGTIRHPVLPYLTASVDRMLYLRSYRKTKHLLAPAWIPVEAKNVSEYKRGDWTPTHVPRMYYTQVQAQLLVSNRPLAILAAVIGGNRMKVYTVYRDEILISQILEEATRFWDLVQTMTLPELDDSEATSDTLVLLNQHAKFKDRKTIDDPEILKKAHRYIRINAAIKNLEALKRGVGNELRLWMAEDANARGDDGTSILYYETKKTEIDEERMIEAKPEIITLRKEVEDIEAQFKKETPSRVLKVSSKSAASPSKKKGGKAKISSPPQDEELLSLPLAA
jgi:putative phage-type endonuclease